MAAPVVQSDAQPPTAPAGLTATVAQDNVQLSWTASSDNVGVAGYRVYRSSSSGYTPGPGFLLATVGSSPTSYTDANVQPGPWYYRLIAFDAAGNASAPSAEVAAVVVNTDTQPPSAPGGLTATVSGDHVQLTWSASTDNRGVSQYRVYRDTTPGFPTSGDFAVVDGGVTTYDDDVNLSTGTFYYKVLALDLAGNQSAASNEVSATLDADVTPPTISIDAACDGAMPVKEYFDIYLDIWDDRANVTVRVLVDGNLAREFPTTPTRQRMEWSTRGRYANGVRVMTVAVRDAAGNETVSEPCLWNVQNPVLTVPVTSPTDGAVVSGVVSVVADPRADGQPLNGFPLRGVGFTVDGASIGSSTSAPFQVTWDTTQVANGVHTVKTWLYWLDYFGEQATSTIQVTVNNGLPQPTAPGSLTANVLAGDDVHLNWGPSTGGTGVTSYRIYRDETLIATRGAAPPREYDDLNLSVGTHTYKVVAVDSAGTSGPPSTEAVVTIAPDTTAPTVTLGGPSCAATVAGYVALRPTVADDRGPVTLRVELDGAIVYGPWTSIGAGPYNVGFDWNIGATPPGLHVMTAYARDAAGNETASDPCLWTVAALSVPFTSPGAGATVSGIVQVNASALLGNQPATTNVTAVVFTVDGAGERVDNSAPYQFSWDTTTVPNGTHTLKAELWWMDYGTPRATSTIQVTVNNPVAPPTTGLVAAYGFDEASGASVTDSSGKGNTGSIAGATRSTSGKYRGALSFDGLNDLVSIADSGSLDLTTGMTLEAWVPPLGDLQLAHGAAQGTARWPHLRDLRRHGHRPARWLPRHRGRAKCARRRRAPAQRLDARRRDLRRRQPSFLRQRHAGRSDRRDGRYPGDDRTAEDRRQQHLVGMVQGTHRRGPRLQPRAHRRRDPGRPRPSRHALSASSESLHADARRLCRHE